MTSQTVLAYGALALAAVAVLAIFPLAGQQLRRREAWELDRAEWRKWMSRP